MVTGRSAKRSPATKTFDAEDCGKAFFCTVAADGDALTLPAIADGLDDCLIVAISAFGTTGIDDQSSRGGQHPCGRSGGRRR